MSIEGSIYNYTYRCIFAIITRLEKRFVRWPNPTEREAIKQEIGKKSFFKDCVGFMDGTYIPLAYAPLSQKEDYYCRKYFYAFNTLLISDHRKQIMYMHHGWCGATHDTRVFKSAQVSLRQTIFKPFLFIYL